MNGNQIRAYVQREVDSAFRDVTQPSSPTSDRGAAVFAHVLNQALGQSSASPGSGAVLAASPQTTASLVEAAGNTYHISPQLVQAVITAESGGDASATSQVGAMGLMQLMPETAKSLGVKDAYNPVENVFAGTHYLREMLDRYGGNVSLALAAYNAGPGAVDKYGGIPPYQETQTYVRQVLDLYQKTNTP